MDLHYIRQLSKQYKESKNLAKFKRKQNLLQSQLQFQINNDIIKKLPQHKRSNKINNQDNITLKQQNLLINFESIDRHIKNKYKIERNKSSQQNAIKLYDNPYRNNQPVKNQSTLTEIKQLNFTPRTMNQNQIKSQRFFYTSQDNFCKDVQKAFIIKQYG